MIGSQYWSRVLNYKLDLVDVAQSEDEVNKVTTRIFEICKYLVGEEGFEEPYFWRMDKHIPMPIELPLTKQPPLFTGTQMKKGKYSYVHVVDLKIEKDDLHGLLFMNRGQIGFCAEINIPIPYPSIAGTKMLNHEIGMIAKENELRKLRIKDVVYFWKNYKPIISVPDVKDFMVRIKAIAKKVPLLFPKVQW